jgi:hypothetical protein
MLESRSSPTAFKWRRTAFTQIDGAVETADDDWPLFIGGLPATRISLEMATVGRPVLRNLTNDLGLSQAIRAARRVFAAMRKLEVQQLEKEQKRGEEVTKKHQKTC